MKRRMNLFPPARKIQPAASALRNELSFSFVMAISILFLTVIDAVFIYGFKFEIQNSILNFSASASGDIICIPLIAA